MKRLALHTAICRTAIVCFVAATTVAAEPPRSKPVKPAPAKTAATAIDKPGKFPDKNRSSVKNVKGMASASRPVRDPAPLIAAIDAEWSARLESAGIPASPEADDAEFLRRACIDLTGVVPSYQQTLLFLNDDGPDKRRRLIDDLLASRGFADHQGRVWRKLIWPPDYTMAKSAQDRVTPWFADQFQAERPWSEVVVELLTVEEKITHDPRGAFFMANFENSSPAPNLLANSAGRLFLGVQIGCAECHNHPFSHWKQEDFWGLAACFSRVRKVSKGDFSLTEDPEPGATHSGAASIVIADGAGKGAGKSVTARFLGSPSSPRSDAPLRRQLAEWITARDNPYFAKATVNRLWAQLFGRGMVNPIDDLRDENPPSHPELLEKLAAEFAASNFDMKHVFRAVCLSKPYGRTSRALPENAADATFFSHMAVKVMTPDVLYDSLHAVLNADPRQAVQQPGQKAAKAVSSRAPVVVQQREPFVRFFSRAALGNDPLTYGYGIPQMLRLLNGAEWNVGAPFLDELSTAAEERTAAIEKIGLVVLSRRLAAEEIADLEQLVVDASTPAEAYGGVFWVLVNGAEFVVNR